MRIRCIKMKEQGIEFFIALVKEDVITEPSQANQTVAMFQQYLRLPVVLCGDLSGNYFGRKDLANFLAGALQASQIRWGTCEIQPAQ